MDLMSSLSDSLWKNSSSNEINGFKNYVILRQKAGQKGKFELHVREDVEDGDLQVAIIDGVTGKCSPLHSVRNVQLKLDGNKVIAMNLDDDCVVRK